MNQSLKSALGHFIAAVLITAMPLQQAQSAPGNLPSSPLFLSTIVEPNIFFTLDDSGSMDYELIVGETTAGIASSGGLPLDSGNKRIGYLHPTWSKLYNARSILPPSNGTDASWDKYWVFRNAQGNKNYYNPSINYIPWVGVKADGTPMHENADPLDALKDPNDNPGTGTKLTTRFDFGGYAASLYLPTYFIWDDDIKISLDINGDPIDTNADGFIDSSDGVPTAPNGIIEQTDGRRMVEILPSDTYEWQNFANWFVYYRSRVNTSKAAIGRVINNTDASRMGFRGFNQGHLKDLETMTDVALKRQLLEKFYDVAIPRAGTPARTALKAAGEMFKSSSSGAILSQANGGECQQNFNILMSDGFWNSTSPSVGNTDISTDNVGFDGDQTESNDGGNYEDSYSNTLADVAMEYYETDLSTLPNRVPVTPGVDENDQQHMVTYTIAFGINGTLDPKTYNPLALGFNWPDPTAGDAEKVDDLVHAAYNGRGKYFNAKNSTELEASLSTAIADISERTGTAAAVAVNSAKLSTESVVYLGQFNTNRWQGNLFAFPIVDTNTGELALTPKWDASSELTLRTKPRQIITYDKSPSTRDGVAFQWADISVDMQKDLKINPAGGSDADAIGEARLDYIRGDRSNEGAGYTFRERISLLGDLVNSGPVFVGAPGLAWPDYAPFPVGPAAYSEFKNGSAASRQKIVYVGANDGMLHAFNDDTGEEMFGYIPGELYSETVNKGLHYLTDPDYIHNYYVDLSPALSDVYISSGASTKWHTVLIGGLRSGGRGLFALNVTDPAAFKESNASSMVLWEFTNDDDPDLGFTFSRPFIGLSNAGKWVAIFGNGYNATGAGSTGEASLFIVDIEAGVNNTWVANGNYKKISTGAGTTFTAGVSPTNPNGLATPALADLDGNGTIDRAYAGDLLGNMWAFDLSGNSPAQWGVAYTGSTPIPLFTTQSNEPITTKPVLASHPTQPNSRSPSNAPNIMVYFGSGQYLVDADKTDTDLQSFYGVWDKGDDSLLATDLIQQEWDINFPGIRVLTRKPVEYATDHGWFFNLTDSGERAVTSAIARADTVFFNSFVPEEDPCSAGGYGYKFAVDMTTGGSPQDPTIDSNDDGLIDENDLQTIGSIESTLAAVRQEGFLPEPVFIEDLAFTAEVATKVKALAKVPTGRFSWQELLQ